VRWVGGIMNATKHSIEQTAGHIIVMASIIADNPLEDAAGRCDTIRKAVYRIEELIKAREGLACRCGATFSAKDGETWSRMLARARKAHWATSRQGGTCPECWRQQLADSTLASHAGSAIAKAVTL